MEKREFKLRELLHELFSNIYREIDSPESFFSDLNNDIDRWIPRFLELNNVRGSIDGIYIEYFCQNCKAILRENNVGKGFESRVDPNTRKWVKTDIPFISCGYCHSKDVTEHHIVASRCPHCELFTWIQGNFREKICVNRSCGSFEYTPVFFNEILIPLTYESIWGTRLNHVESHLMENYEQTCRIIPSNNAENSVERWLTWSYYELQYLVKRIHRNVPIYHNILFGIGPMEDDDE